MGLFSYRPGFKLSKLGHGNDNSNSNGSDDGERTQVDSSSTSHINDTLHSTSSNGTAVNNARKPASKPQAKPPATGMTHDGRVHIQLADLSCPELFGPDYDLPRLRGFYLWHRKWSMFAYATFILMCNVAAPCVLYYTLQDHTNLSGHALLGIASATLGISSSFDNPFRMWKLWKHRDLYGPLNDPGPKWHLDWTMHLYSFALFPMLAIPLAIASSVNPPLYNFFNMWGPMLVSPLGVFFLVSLFKVGLPFWVSSDAPYTPLKPGIFYIFEDMGAVDFRLGKAFRAQLHARYNASPLYRDMLWWLTVFWIYGVTVYSGAVAAVNWTAPFWFSYGFTLGLLFIWLVTWTATSILIARTFRQREDVWLALKKKGDAEQAHQMTLEGRHELRRDSRRFSRTNSRKGSRSASHSGAGSHGLSEDDRAAMRERMRVENEALRLEGQHEGDAAVVDSAVVLDSPAAEEPSQSQTPTSPASPRKSSSYARTRRQSSNHNHNPGFPSAAVTAQPATLVSSPAASPLSERPSVTMQHSPGLLAHAGVRPTSPLAREESGTVAGAEHQSDGQSRAT